MSLDRSLKSANALIRHRNVLTRAERLERLAEEEKWTDSKSVFGLPKVANRKLEIGKDKAEAAEGDDAAAGAAGAGAAPAAGAAAGAKGAAPAGAKGAAAGGAKGAAPAAAGAKAAPAAKGAAPAGKKK